MKNKKQLKALISGILVAALLLGLVAGAVTIMASAASSTEIKQEIDKLQSQQDEIENQISGLEGQLMDNHTKLEATIAEKNAIDQEVYLLYQKVSNINDQIAAYNELIAEKQAELDEAQEHLRQLNEKNKERIQAMEEDGQVSYWSVLFKANSFSDLLDRLNMVEEIAASDQRRLEEMNRAAEAVAKAKEELAAEKEALSDVKEELLVAQEELEAKRAEAEALLQELVARGMEYQDLLDAAEAENAAMMAEISKLNSAYDAAKQREYEQWLATQPKPQPPAASNDSVVGGGASGGSVVVGSDWLVPISYTAFTSPFGYRDHPVYGGWRFHYGVDLAAPTGTPIYASRGGQVTTATYGASGGYYVVINHMDGYTSNYLHMTHFVVAPGQYVSAGQVIGYCGSTGASTGPHLHFAIYKNGTAVNPALYIAI